MLSVTLCGMYSEMQLEDYRTDSEDIQAEIAGFVDPVKVAVWVLFIHMIGMRVAIWMADSGHVETHKPTVS